MIDERIKNRVAQLHSEGMSLTDIAQKVNIKKHTVEGILKGIRENAETPIDTPTTRFQTPTQKPLADTLGSDKLAKENEKLREKCEQLQEKLHEKDIFYSKQLAKLELEVSILKSGESLKKQELELKKFEINKAHELENKKLLQEQTKQQKAEFAAQSKSLDRSVKKFIESFYDEIDDGTLEAEIDLQDCKKYMKAAQKYQAEIVALFDLHSPHYFLYSQALQLIMSDLKESVEKGRDANLCYEDCTDELNLLADCLHPKVFITDTENIYPIEEEDED